MADEQAPVAAELNEVKKRQPYRRFLLIFGFILLIFILLVLFWPVPRSAKNTLNKPTITPTGAGIVGLTKYKALSAQKVIENGGRRQTNWVLIVSFEVENLADEAQVLDYSHIKLVDNLSTEYPPSPGLTNLFYQFSKKESPWESSIGARKLAKAQVVFAISEASRKFELAGRDLNWRSNRFVEVPLKVDEPK